MGLLYLFTFIIIQEYSKVEQITCGNASDDGAISRQSYKGATVKPTHDNLAQEIFTYKIQAQYSCNIFASDFKINLDSCNDNQRIKSYRIQNTVEPTCIS